MRRGLVWKAAIGCHVFVEAVLGVRHWVVGHRLAAFLTQALVRIWRDGSAILFTGIIDSIRKKGVATRDGWLYSEIGVFSHMSCEFELFMTTVV